MRPARHFSALLVLVLSAAAGRAQTTAAQKQLSRIDLGVSGAGMFNRSSTGTINITGAPNNGTSVSNVPSNTFGALVDLRYIAKPFVGLEFNTSYARYTENYSNAGGIQTNVTEATFGYVATPAHPIFGFQPFVSAGAGTTRFKPTPGGGQGLQPQWRATYYYSAGLQQDVFGPHLGVRAAFRQTFFLAPDFGQNYLTIKQRTSTIEPSVGFYLRF